jgi:hypothetical protein
MTHVLFFTWVQVSGTGRYPLPGEMWDTACATNETFPTMESIVCDHETSATYLLAIRSESVQMLLTGKEGEALRRDELWFARFSAKLKDGAVTDQSSVCSLIFSETTSKIECG